MDKSRWADYKSELTVVFKTKTRDEWCGIMEGTDICFAPVLSLDEVAHHPHNSHRDTFVELEGVTQPAPSPRFDRTVPKLTHAARKPGEDSREVLSAAGFSDMEIESLIDNGAIRQAE